MGNAKAHATVLSPHSRLRNSSKWNTGSDAAQRRYEMWNSKEWVCVWVRVSLSICNSHATDKWDEVEPRPHHLDRRYCLCQNEIAGYWRQIEIETRARNVCIYAWVWNARVPSPLLVRERCTAYVPDPYIETPNVVVVGTVAISSIATFVRMERTA